MAILVVRHADAGDRKRWDGDDSLRPLTASGRRQAGALVELLSSYRFHRILSSPYVRCVETVRPLAVARRLVVEAMPALAEGHTSEAMLTVGLEHAGAGVVLCTHGDVMHDLLERLIELAVIRPKSARMEKACTWVLEAEGGSIRRAGHIPPP